MKDDHTPQTTPPLAANATVAQGRVEIIHASNLDALPALADASFDLIYIDPPFNTGKRQQLHRVATTRDEEGERAGFGGNRYRTQSVSQMSYEDTFDDYLGFLRPRLEQAKRLLTATGSFFCHVDPREVHYVKVLCDQIFGRASFLGEIIWAYDFGGRSKRKWSQKHDNILWYAVDPKRYTFNFDAMERIPYMAPGLVGKAKAARGKTPTDVWWHTIVPTNGKERTGYPTQKPVGILRRIIAVHTRPNDRVLDFFAGSGTLGEAAAIAGRDAVLIDENPEAIAVMRRRLAPYLTESAS